MLRNGNWGAQAVDRAIAILRLLGSAGMQGVRVADIQAELGLTRPTAHRLINVLVRHGLATNDPEARRYYLGFETALMGWSATRQSFDLREVCQQALVKIARETGDTAILVVRSGDEGVFIDYKSGPHPMESMTVTIGARRPLGAGATGVAILAAMPQSEVNRVLEANRHRFAKYHHLNEQLVRRAVRAARAAGYAVSEGMLTPRLRGVAVPITMSAKPVGAIGVTTISKLTKARLSIIARVLSEQRRSLERDLVALGEVAVRGTFGPQAVARNAQKAGQLIE